MLNINVLSFFDQQAVLGWPNLQPVQVISDRSQILERHLFYGSMTWGLSESTHKSNANDKIVNSFTHLLNLHPHPQACLPIHTYLYLWSSATFQNQKPKSTSSQACLPIHMRLLGCLTISLCLPLILPWSRVRSSNFRVE